MNIDVEFKKTILRDDIRKYLSNAIMKGEYKPGDRIIETQVAKTLGVSQAPVREALRDLEQMGIIEVEPYKGGYVKELSVQDLKDIYSVRAEMEGLAIRLAIPHITNKEIEELENVYEKMVVASTTDNLEQQISFDNKFHSIIVMTSGNKMLERVWQRLCLPYWTYYGTLLYQKGKKDLVPRHRAIMEAIYNKDILEADKAMHDHFFELQQSL